MTPHSRDEFRGLLGLSAPVAAAQLAMMAMSGVDMTRIARVGVAELVARDRMGNFNRSGWTPPWPRTRPASASNSASPPLL